MADSTITALGSLAILDTSDVFVVVDISDASMSPNGTNKKLTLTALLASAALDTLATPSDSTTLNATTSAHGLCPKLSGSSGEFLNGEGAFATPAGSGAPEGTAVLSTGEVGGTKFLREDGDGTCSWQAPAGSGDMLAATYDPTSVAGDAFDVDNHVDGTTNKVYPAADKSKLAAIEASADVTDATNVAAAGALMDSEVDADIKTLSLPASTTISTFGASVVDDADAATARTTLGAAPQEVTINAQTGTTYTTVLGDNGKLVTLSNAAAITLTIPTNASVAYPVGTTIAFQQIGAGLATMSGAGVTFNNRNGLVSGGQYAMWSITKTATDTWAVAGDLTT